MTLKSVLAVTTFTLLMPCALVRAQSIGATNQPTATELKLLQGTWEGFLVGQESAGKVTVKITGNSLHFQGLKTNDWYETTFTLPAETNPRQLRATITGCQRTNDIGAVIGAIFKIEDGVLTLAGIQDRDQEPPESFGEDKPQFKIEVGTFNLVGRKLSAPAGSEAFEGNTMFRYDLKRVQPQGKQPDSPKSK
jgi:uncharacterized protein (TIGR03067 family)